MIFDFPRYLTAKKSVDDRAPNRRVWQWLAGALPRRPMRVLEVGAGVGTMVERAVEWGLLSCAEYTALDALSGNIAAARRRLPAWAEQAGYAVGQAAEGGLILEKGEQQVQVVLVAADLFDFIRREQGQQPWDLLIAHAFLDLMDIPATLPQLFSLARPGGWFYFTINFDGATLLEPVIDPALDEQIERLYHQSMDERFTDGKPSGDSRAGRHLFGHLRQAGAQIMAAGASDWVVFAGADGRYAQDEAYFLQFIIYTIHQALSGRPELESGRFEAWVAARYAQIERGELVYIAHQLDFAGRIGAPPEP
jgi:SAM-dependent methyltransferase